MKYFIFLKNNLKLANLFYFSEKCCLSRTTQFIVFTLRASLNLQLHFFVFLWANKLFLERSHHSWQIKKSHGNCVTVKCWREGCCGLFYILFVSFFPIQSFSKNNSKSCTCITALKKHVFPKLLSPFTVISPLAVE